LDESIEEIVGRLTDEGVGEHPLAEIDEHATQTDGLVRLDEANQELGIELPGDGHHETVAGFILYQLRRIPNEGERLHHGDLNITVQEKKGPTIGKVLITRV
jgi:putative hemolysin